MALKAGGRSTEFWGMVGLAVMVMAGWIQPEQATKAVQSQGTAINALLDTIQNIVSTKGDIALYAGILWAYLKRRTELKALEIKGGK